MKFRGQPWPTMVGHDQPWQPWVTSCRDRPCPAMHGLLWHGHGSAKACRGTARAWPRHGSCLVSIYGSQAIDRGRAITLPWLCHCCVPASFGSATAWPQQAMAKAKRWTCPCAILAGALSTSRGSVAEDGHQCNTNHPIYTPAIDPRTIN